MGVSYKLQPEVKEFILTKKKADSGLSCRKIAKLVEEELKILVSKSSINEFLKSAGLSSPMKREIKKEEKPKSKISGLLTAQQPGFEQLPEKEQSKIASPPAAARNDSGKTITRDESFQHPVVPQTPISPSIPAIPQEPQSIQQDMTKERDTVESDAFSSFAEGEVSGAILLKAIDSIIGGICWINALISREMNQNAEDLLDKTEALAYARIFAQIPYVDLDPNCPVWTLIGQKLSNEEISVYLSELQRIPILATQVYQFLPNLFKEARGIKIILANGTFFYLDSQLHTIWSTQHIPFDFSLTISRIKSYINKYFTENAPFVLFMAPGFDLPIKEFFELIASFISPEHKSISSLSLYGNKFEDLDMIRLDEVKKRRFVFGLWPWQFVQYRKVNQIKEFRPFYSAGLRMQFYLAEVEIELLQPHASKGVTLRGCALKTGPNEKTRLIILGNFPAQELNLEEICATYLNHWPNLEESFQDYSRKIELFTYTAGSQRVFPADEIDKFKAEELNIDNIFDIYLKMLDLYLRWHCFPSGYENKDFSTMKEQFYKLEAVLKAEEDCYTADIKPPAQPAAAKDLEYALRRLNELNPALANGKKLWFRLKPLSCQP